MFRVTSRQYIRPTSIYYTEFEKARRYILQTEVLVQRKAEKLTNLQEKTTNHQERCDGDESAATPERNANVARHRGGAAESA